MGSENEESKPEVPPEVSAESHPDPMTDAAELAAIGELPVSTDPGTAPDPLTDALELAAIADLNVATPATAQEPAAALATVFAIAGMVAVDPVVQEASEDDEQPLGELSKADVVDGQVLKTEEAPNPEPGTIADPVAYEAAKASGVITEIPDVKPGYMSAADGEDDQGELPEVKEKT